MSGTIPRAIAEAEALIEADAGRTGTVTSHTQDGKSCPIQVGERIINHGHYVNLTITRASGRVLADLNLTPQEAYRFAAELMQHAWDSEGRAR